MPYEALLHQIDDHRRESRLDHVSADSPDDWLLQFARTMNPFGKLTNTIAPQARSADCRENHSAMHHR